MKYLLFLNQINYLYKLKRLLTFRLIFKLRLSIMVQFSISGILSKCNPVPRTLGFILSLLLLHPAFSQSTAVHNQPLVLQEYCVSQDEMILYNLVNDIRKQQKLTVIPLSKSLSIVAKVHIEDLLTWNPQELGCNLHSWSKTGRWSACCNGKDPLGTKCMNMKPGEITGYPGNGYELIYWDEEMATPNEASNLWFQVSASREMLLNQGKWQNRKWNALGICISNGYAIIWLGEKLDQVADIHICGSDTLVQSAGKSIIAEIPVPQKKESSEVRTETITPDKSKKDISPENHIFIVVASLKTEQLAKERVKELKDQGYSDAILVPNPEKFRVSLGSYKTDKEAITRMKTLKANFPDCWLLRM